MPSNTMKQAALRQLYHFTAKYTKIDSGYMGQLMDWPEVVSEGRTLEACRDALRDALREMVAAYRQLGKAVPQGGGLLEHISVEL
jgi:predicted RNase H-like HicB family nuclease